MVFLDSQAMCSNHRYRSFLWQWWEYPHNMGRNIQASKNTWNVVHRLRSKRTGREWSSKRHNIVPWLYCTLLFCPVLLCPSLSCPVLFCSVLSNPTLTYIVISLIVCSVFLSCSVIPCPALSCFSLSYTTLTFSLIAYPFIWCPVLSVLSCICF